jgi:purine nucleoside permease
MNATATLMALGLNDRFDVSKTYIMIAGIAGTPPNRTTLGAAAWAEYIVYGGLADGMDPREQGFDWDYMLARLGCTAPWCERGAITTGTEVYHLNPTLRDWAYQLSKDVALADSAQAEQYRQLFSEETARRKPFVTKCDGLMSDTFWTGARMSAWASWWVKQQTGGAGTYCMAAFEDSGTLTALTRLSTAKRVDLQRVLVLRAASNFDQPHPEQTATAGLRGNLDGASGGSDIAFENLYRAGSAFNTYLLQHWSDWQTGIPALPR